MNHNLFDQESNFKTNFYNPFMIRNRKKTNKFQLNILESIYSKNTKPSLHMRTCLSEELKMTAREVQVWFQNRRAKDKLKLEKSLQLINNENNLSSSSFLQPPITPIHQQFQDWNIIDYNSIINPINKNDFNNFDFSPSPSFQTFF